VRVFTYIADHPWRFFGPLLGALVGYLGRSLISSSNQDALASGLDASQPLHPREVAALGRANRVTRGAWDAAVGVIFDALSLHLMARFGARRVSGAEFDAATALRPSEVEAALLRGSGGGGGCAPLCDAHALRRAAAWLAMRAEGGGPFQPATDREARAYLEAAAWERRGGGWALPNGHAGAGPYGAELAGEAAPGGVVRGALALLGLSGEPPVAPPWEVAPAPEGGDPARYRDAPLPLLDALCLYSAVVGGSREVGYLGAAGEEEEEEVEGGVKGAGGGGSDQLPPPSRRVHLLVGVARRVAELRGAWVEGASSPPPPPPLPSPSPHPGADPGLAPAYTMEELSSLLEALGRTFQVPSRNRAGVSHRWPVQRFALAGGAAILAAGLEEAGIDLNKSPSPPKALVFAAPGDTGLKTGVPKPAPGEPQALPPHLAPRAWLTRDEARRALLQARAVCLWGDCNSTENRPEYKGGIF
jgi:hypothetical protein